MEEKETKQPEVAQEVTPSVDESVFLDSMVASAAVTQVTADPAMENVVQPNYPYNPLDCTKIPPVTEALSAIKPSDQEEPTLDLPEHQEEIAEAKDQEAEEKPAVPNQVAMFRNPLSSGADLGSPEVIMLPPDSFQNTEDSLNRIPNEDLKSLGQLEWGAALRAGVQLIPDRDAYGDVFAPESEAANVVNHAGKMLRGAKAATAKKEGNVVLEGERAYLNILNHLGTGAVFRTPLWNSGFYIYFKPATEPQFLELLTGINLDTLQLGRSSYGLALSNDTVYTLNRAYDFALSHVYSTTIKSTEYQTMAELKKYIKEQDIWSVLWGFLCACYPGGTHYRQPCVANPETCNHVDSGHIDLTLLQVPLKSKLPEYHRNHMTKIAYNSMTLESIKTYQDTLPCQAEKRVLFNKGTPHEIALTFKTQSSEYFVNQGYNYIGNIVDAVAASFREELNEVDRNKLINQTGKAETLCKYIHLVKEIEYGDLSDEGAVGAGKVSIRDDDGIRRTLAHFSSIDNLREAILDEIIIYINQAAASVIGIPTYKCPKCGGGYRGEKDADGNVIASYIPIDILQLFFVLVSQRVRRIETR